MDSLLKCFKDKPKNICVMKNRKKTNKVHLLGTYLCILYLFLSPQSTVLTSVTFQSPLLFFYKLVQAKICIKTTFPPHFRYAKCKLENPLIRVLAGLGKFLVQLYKYTQGQFEQLRNGNKCVTLCQLYFLIYINGFQQYLEMTNRSKST